VWKNAALELIAMLPPQLGQKPKQRGPGLFQATLGSVSGLVTAGVLGLFAVGLYPAIATGDLRHLFKYPHLVAISWLICAPSGWILGWLVGPQLGRRYNSPRIEIIAGLVAGLVPVAAIVLCVVLFGSSQP
jgi:hypothetical protein